jgi:hypothetical protein
VATKRVARREPQGRGAVGGFIGVVVIACSVGALYGAEVVGVSRLRGVLAGILAGAFYATAYIASRASSLRPFRKVIIGSTGLMCGCLCAGLLGWGTSGVILSGLGGLALGVSVDIWLPGI